MVKRRILIVDDDVAVARQLEARLAEHGYEVSAIASSEADACAMSPSVESDLVLIDLDQIGGTNDIESAKEVRRNWKIPLVFMIQETDEASLRAAGVTEPYGYLVKPFTDRELRGFIELALCKQKAAVAIHEMEDSFFVGSIDMLCFLDYNGYFKRLNPAWERTLGFSRKELMSRPFIEFVHPEDRERTLMRNAHVRSGGQALSFENRYMCKDGSYRWLHWNAAPDPAEKLIYSVARDITATKQLEEERERLVGELQTALAEVKSLRAILPICSYCRKIRDDENYWDSVENYISRHTRSRFSHGICPSCLETQVESLDKPRTG